MKARLATEIKDKKQIFDFECVTLIEDVSHSYYGSPFVLMELAGAMTAIRAAWAHLVKNRDENDSGRTDVSVRLVNTERTIYVKPKRKIYNVAQGKNMVLYAQGMGPRERQYFLGGDLTTPSVYFLDAFRINVNTVPILREWAPELWRLGLEKGLIEPLPVYGSSLNAWKIKTEVAWANIAKEVAKAWLNSQQ